MASTIITEDLKKLSIKDENIELIGEDYQSDDEFYIIKCRGIDKNKNKYVKLKVRRPEKRI
jgi:hypothetical protein